MSETILVQFKEGGVPKEGLSPLIYIREENWDLDIDGDAMTEIDNWWYYYEYENYIRTRTYLIDADGWAELSDSDRYSSNINELDSYQNKGEWRWPAVFIDYDKIADLSADKVWDEKMEDHKKDGTFWVGVVSSVDIEPVLKEINKQYELIKNVKIPLQSMPKIPEFNYGILIKAIENNKPELLDISKIIAPIIKSIEAKDVGVDLSPLSKQIEAFDKWMSMNFNSIISKLNKKKASKKDKDWKVIEEPSGASTVYVINKMDDVKLINELWTKIDTVHTWLKSMLRSLNKDKD